MATNVTDADLPVHQDALAEEAMNLDPDERIAGSSLLGINPDIDKNPDEIEEKDTALELEKLLNTNMEIDNQANIDVDIPIEKLLEITDKPVEEPMDVPIENILGIESKPDEIPLDLPLENLLDIEDKADDEPLNESIEKLLLEDSSVDKELPIENLLSIEDTTSDKCVEELIGNIPEASDTLEEPTEKPMETSDKPDDESVEKCLEKLIETPLEAQNTSALDNIIDTSEANMEVSEDTTDPKSNPLENSSENDPTKGDNKTENTLDADSSNTETKVADKEINPSATETDKNLEFENDNAMDIASISMDDFKNESTVAEEESSDPFATKEQPLTEHCTNSNSMGESMVSADQIDSARIEEAKDDGETILPEEEQEKEGKYIITHCNDNEEKACAICEKSEIAKYVAQRSDESVFICNNDCLVVFKEKNVNNYVEKILRLRAFASQDKKSSVERAATEDKEEEFECEVDDDFSKDSMRKCGSCKTSIDSDNYIAWEAVDYCNEGCLLNFQRTINCECARCRKVVLENLLGKFCVRFGNLITQFCSTTCLLAYKKCFKFCAYCQEDLRNNTNEYKNFCSKRCQERCHPDRVVKDKSFCAVCHQLKAIEIKIRTSIKIDCFCGEPCFVAYKFVNKIEPTKCEMCTTHFVPLPDDPVMYVDTNTIMLCSKECQKIYLIANRKIVICCNCSVKKYDFDMIKLCEAGKGIAFACSNSCLQTHLEKTFTEQFEKMSDINFKQLESAIKDYDFIIEGKNLMTLMKQTIKDVKVPYHKITLTKPRPYVKQRNVATMCKPLQVSIGVSCKPSTNDSLVQTDQFSNNMYVPIPVPIYVPTPVHMYTQPVPVPVPIPIPLPIPIFIPTQRKSVSGILKEIQKIKNRVPADPLEAEILMMAEMAAGPKKDESSSESEAEEPVKAEEPFQNEGIDAGTSFGEDVLTMALKMASDFEEPAELEGPAASTVVPAQAGQQESIDAAARIENIMETKRKSIRQAKRKSRQPDAVGQSAPPLNMEGDKPDANLCLKYTFGVNAWKQWVTTKNLDLTKASKKPKLFKSEILQLTADDLNYSLCLFVKEVRKPSGAEYAPDTIYYLCLGIQQFLYENGRIDNIFCDTFYEKFTDTFNEVCQKFANLYNDSQYIVTRVEEEHLWESKQLGAHSPLVLLNTLMFFNTKHFSLTTVDEHLQLSFSHIMKHWKRNPNHPGARNVLLRFYPPQNAVGSGRKKKVYEQQENDENPLRCPVKLYEFYLSKCPESVKTRNDVFYLQPERSCVPDSPVWYSTMALSKEPLEKMLNRVKMVKEINVALLTS